jgi:L-aspartate oxidase
VRTTPVDEALAKTRISTRLQGISSSASEGISIQNFSYLDATKVDTEILNSHFPAIKQECLIRIGLNLEKEFIPIIPVQHYSCGGIKVDEFGETSISGLFAIGELASTGLHGANRLASNSLFEAIAFAKFAIPKLTQPNKEFHNVEMNEALTIFKSIDKKAVQHIMSKYAGIVKSKEGLSKAFEALSIIKENAAVLNKFNLENFESNCILEVAIMLIQDAQNQTSNKGVYYNIDLV